MNKSENPIPNNTEQQNEVTRLGNQYLGELQIDGAYDSVVSFVSQDAYGRPRIALYVTANGEESEKPYSDETETAFILAARQLGGFVDLYTVPHAAEPTDEESLLRTLEEHALSNYAEEGFSPTVEHAGSVNFADLNRNGKKASIDMLSQNLVDTQDQI